MLRDSLAVPKAIDPGVLTEDTADKWRRLVHGVLDERRRDVVERCVLDLDTLMDVRELWGLLEPVVKSPMKA